MPTTSAKSTLQILQEARALIANPMRWTRKANARDAYGNAVEHDWPSAVCWCARGALLVAGDAPWNGDARWQLSLQMPKSSQNITVYNDAHEHADVLALFDRAIAAQCVLL